MNRRDFLRVTGLAGLAAALGWQVAKPEPKVHYSFEATQVRSLNEAIMSIDPEDLPYLAALGKGQRIEVGDWPNHKVEWLEDTLIPR